MRNKLSISDLSFCPRKAFFSYFYRPYGYVKPNTTIHEVILSKLENDGYKIEVPVSYYLKDGFKLVGRVDAVGRDHIIEVKTVKEFDFNIRPYWLAQVNMYMHILSLHSAKLLIVDRSARQVFSCNITYNKKIVEEMLELGKQVINAIKLKDFTIIPKSNNCQYCHFNIICKIC